MSASVIRAIAWVTLLVGGGVFIALWHPLGSSSDVFIVFLPLLVAWVGLLLLLWVGALPGTRWRSRSKRGGSAFWLAVVLLCVFCAFLLYLAFFFRT
jgi:hypothetical protein